MSIPNTILYEQRSPKRYIYLGRAVNNKQWDVYFIKRDYAHLMLIIYGESIVKMSREGVLIYSAKVRSSINSHIARLSLPMQDVYATYDIYKNDIEKWKQIYKPFPAKKIK